MRGGEDYGAGKIPIGNKEMQKKVSQSGADTDTMERVVRVTKILSPRSCLMLN